MLAKRLKGGGLDRAHCDLLDCRRDASDAAAVAACRRPNAWWRLWRSIFWDRSVRRLRMSSWWGSREETLSAFPYRSPIDRAFLASVIDALARSGVAAVGLDVVLDRPTEPAEGCGAAPGADPDGHSGGGDFGRARHDDAGCASGASWPTSSTACAPATPTWRATGSTMWCATMCRCIRPPVMPSFPAAIAAALGVPVACAAVSDRVAAQTSWGARRARRANLSGGSDRAAAAGLAEGEGRADRQPDRRQRRAPHACLGLWAAKLRRGYPRAGRVAVARSARGAGAGGAVARRSRQPCRVWPALALRLGVCLGRLDSRSLAMAMVGFGFIAAALTAYAFTGMLFPVDRDRSWHCRWRAAARALGEVWPTAATGVRCVPCSPASSASRWSTRS